MIHNQGKFNPCKHTKFTLHPIRGYGRKRFGFGLRDKREQVRPWIHKISKAQTLGLSVMVRLTAALYFVEFLNNL